ncbi:RnfABCDGE type electron transport complex subunit B [Rhodoferax sp.]|uniref:RnfABCDGE type electron transport complex subunit B n=1 Tax=Rhodoferax sp. TaxID=50421 RepID=UPI0025F052D9|nr:RnfABCDGE type electron transport complex subunit B [Rhodoferax sp.]
MPQASTASGLAAQINAALPQTQCTRCGYPDCAAYAQAIAEDSAPINQCPPGGAEGIARLAAITGQPALALNPDFGIEAVRTMAVIDEAWCIGCTLCIAACPTDAIFGSNKRMHSVISAHCTSCELCLPACPVDCIQMLNASGSRTGWSAWSTADAEHARLRYANHSNRLSQDVRQSPKKHEEKIEAEPVAAAQASPPIDPKKATIAAALARARAQRAAPPG